MQFKWLLLYFCLFPHKKRAREGVQPSIYDEKIFVVIHILAISWHTRNVKSITNEDEIMR